MSALQKDEVRSLKGFPSLAFCVKIVGYKTTKGLMIFLFSAMIRFGKRCSRMEVHHYGRLS